MSGRDRDTESEMTTQTLSPPQLSTLRIEIDGEIGTLTLDRPDVFNAMSPEMIGEFTVAFAWFADRAPLRALIVTGAGKAFSSGGDVTWFRKGVESEDFDLPSDVRRGAEVLHQAIIDLRRIPYPVIAAVNGPAAGAGFSLALACDIRIAAENAFFAPAYGRIGASPDGGMTYFLPRVVGPSRALEILLEDPNMSAADALAERLVSEVAPGDELMDRARQKAEKLATMAPHYVRMAKILTGQSIENSLSDHLQLERHGIADSMGTEDLRSGVQAFFAGDKPEFEGR
jgi:enoyl-CoA hydratase/carnithine racemase